MSEEHPPAFGSDTGYVFEHGMKVFTALKLSLKLDGEAVGFVPDVLQKVQFGRISMGADFILHVRFDDVFEIYEPGTATQTPAFGPTLREPYQINALQRDSQIVQYLTGHIHLALPPIDEDQVGKGHLPAQGSPVTAVENFPH